MSVTSVHPKEVGRLERMDVNDFFLTGEVYVADDVDKILANDHDLIMEQKEEISKLKIKVNKLQQKIGE